MKSSKFDLEERTAKFGENVIKFCHEIPKSSITNPLITQLVKAGISVGANYSEADDAESKLDFRHKIGICKKRSKGIETLFKNDSYCSPRAKGGRESFVARSKRAFNLIFNTIYKKVS